MRSLAMNLVAAAALSVAAAGCANGQGGGAQKTASYDKPGFVTEVHDGRLWVFRKDAKELAEFKKNGELGKQVTRVGAGPNKMTMKGPDAETIDAYLAAK
jgi:hypothetical protein